MLPYRIVNKLCYPHNVASGRTYEEALAYFLTKRGLRVDRQVSVPVEVDGKRLETQLRIDLLVERRIIVELKSVLDMREVFHLQLLTYLKLTKLYRGVLVNFNTDDIENAIWLKANGYNRDAVLPEYSTE